ncbi:MAG: hypothetical protein MJE77_27635 [Proteobacteria bacterium]|nr:hypothetical protein [Pseudomonadota bacterium]
MFYRCVGLCTVLLTVFLSWGCAAGDAGRAPVPHSLHDTVPDGALHADADGQFVAGTDAIRFFDYFLTSEGEVTTGRSGFDPSDSIDGVRLLVEQEVAEKLSDSAAASVMTAFDDYVAYRQQTAQLFERGGDPEAVRSEFARIHRDAVARLPGIAADLDGLERALAIHEVLSGQPGGARPASLTGAMRAELIRIDRSISGTDEVAANAEVARVAVDLHRATARLRADGASAGDIHDLRTARVGPGAADRLAALDRRRAEWQRRIGEYRAARDEISASLTDANEREQALARWIDSHFDSREKLRLRAVDRIAGRPATR